MALVDLLIVALFIFYAIASGLRNRRAASRNLEAYFLADRSLPGWKAGLSMAATQFAADTPLLVTGLVATAGIFALWQLWIYALAFLLMGFLLAPAWRRAGVVTDAELTEARYGGRAAVVLRGVKAVWFGTVFNCVVLAFVFFAAAKIAEPFLVWDVWLPPALFDPVVALVEWVGAPLTIGAPDDPAVWVRTASNLISLVLILTVAAFYSMTGGLRSVVATDVVQLAVMFAGTAAFAWLAVRAAGGLAALPARVGELYGAGGPGGIRPDEILAFTPGHARDASAAVLALFGLQWLIQINADGTGYLAQRSMACRSDADARTAAIVFTFTQVLLRSLLWIPLALGLLVLFPPDAGGAGALDPALLQADREATYVRGMVELLPAGLRGLMVTAMLAALASTVDTHLNWGASYWANDLYRRFVCQIWLGREPSPRSLVRVARASNVVLTIVALGIMTRLTSINQAWQVSLLLGAGIGVVLILRWIWWRMNAWGEIAAIAASVVAAPALMAAVPDDQHAVRLLGVAVVATAAALLAVAVAGPEERTRLVAFYRKVRPAGFWGPVAREVAGLDDARGPGLRGRAVDRGPARLARAGAATGACALSIFCLLVGIGSWMVGSPGPSWAGPASAWHLGLVAVGLALTPIWWRLR